MLFLTQDSLGFDKIEIILDDNRRRRDAMHDPEASTIAVGPDAALKTSRTLDRTAT